MPHELPARANLEYLKKQAKELLHAAQSGNPEAVAHVRALAPDLEPTAIKLADAQHLLAQVYGFANWAALKKEVASRSGGGVDPLQELADAIGENDVDAVADVLAREPELRRRLNGPLPGAPFGGTALLGAVSRGNREMIDVLLAAGADINQRSHWWAGGFGVLDEDHNLVDFLVSRGATVDAYAAARHGLLDRLDSIVARDPSAVRMRGGDGQTPLHVARNVEVARYLVEHGADIDALDVDHESTPAQYLLRDRPDVVRYLVSRGCRTDIFLAAALGDLALVRSHLDADPKSVQLMVTRHHLPMRNLHAGGHIYTWVLGTYKTPHRVARDSGHDDVYRLLMERSPDELKLAVAVEVGDEAVVRDLSARAPELVRRLDTVGRRKLVDAAQNNDTAAVGRLTRAGWPLDVRGQHAATPLHWAAFHGNTEMVKDLVSAGADVHLRGDQYNATPLGWAITGSRRGWYVNSGDYAGTVDALLDAGAMPPDLEQVDASDAVRAVLQRRLASS